MDVLVERTIGRPAVEVFEFFADAANNPLWQKGMMSCRWTSPAPIGIGSTYEQHARFMGRPVVSTFQVTEYEPGRMIAIETISGTFPIQVRREVEPLGEDACLVRAHISGGPRGAPKLLNPLTDRMARKSIEADYDRLVDRFAGGQDANG